MTFLDLLVIALYGVAVLAIGLWAGRGHQRSGELFVGNRSLPTWAVLFSMVATELSAATFIGVPHAAYIGNWTYLQLAFGALLGKLALGLYVIPLYHRLGTITVYGLLENRFGPDSRRSAALAFSAGRILASGVRLFIAALAFSVVTDLPVSAAIWVCGLIAGVYTLAGGIRSVIWTDVLQGAVFITAALVLVVALVWQAGAGSPLRGFEQILNWACAHDRMQVFQFSPLFALGDARPFFVGVIGGAFLTLATHGTDYDMVQRLLTTRSGKSGGRALIGSAILNFPLTIVFLFIGTGIAAVYQQPPAYDISDSSRILPIFAIHELPAGARGLLFAGLFAAAMSSLDSAVCAIATTWSVDILPAAQGETALLRRMRIASLLCCGLLIASALAMAAYYASFGQAENGGASVSLVDLALSAMTILYGGLLGIFALALFSRKRGSDRSAVWGLVVGVLAGIVLFLHPLLLSENREVTIAWPWWIPISSALAFATASLGKRSRAG